jgi:hypothetical protein
MFGNERGYEKYLLEFLDRLAIAGVPKEKEAIHIIN